ncbi:BREX-5 system phosphatase PglZ [Salinibacter ruber]|uniref:BREX-5 system phosphatase PglZ n=1 Tax=Salinibacter ruber TaxID=146919 RepID=UPI0015E0974C|nr:BREX-5 system phosphatase PglZ [Salinibacter ruber]
MTKTSRARHSLREEAQEVLRQHFESAPGPRSRFLWWDAGGHLRDVVRRACQELDVPFVEEEHPLAFRQWVAEQGASPSDEPDEVVWYVPDAPRDRDWFRDVRHMGGIVEKSIEDLAADLYGIKTWQLRISTTDRPVSDRLAAILLDNLRGSSHPTLQQLQGRLVIQADEGIIEYLLRDGWQMLPRTGDKVETVRSLLEDRGVPGLSSDEDPEAMVDAVRHWAVAGWLSQAGMPDKAFPDAIADSDLGYAYRRLKAVLREDLQSKMFGTYQHRYWDEVIDQIEDPWTLTKCPVDGALDERLWMEWAADFEAERFEACREHAAERSDALREHTGRQDESVDKGTPPWIRVWRQAAALADLAHRYETWDQRDAPVHTLYADREEGSWQIDAAVRRIIVSGTPEQELPSGHPARESLAYHRERLVETEYLDYLRDLGNEMETALAQGDLVDDNLSSAVHFWSDHEKELGAGNEALFFYLDALRLDLARELADQLQARSDDSDELDLNVEESSRLGVLPSETEFGMAAVLPGRPKSYEVRLDNGALNAYRNGSPLNADKRRKLLEEEGWAVASDDPSGWSQTRVAYYSKEIDDYGEASMQDIERRLAERVRTLADEIFDRIRKGDWNRAYVVTDHGFVLLPEDAQFEDLTPPGGDVKRRRVAAEDLSDDGPGVLLTGERVPELFSYLSSPVRLLLDPQHRFKKQGIPDSRYYHGGALPQECILSFLKIEAA